MAKILCNFLEVPRPCYPEITNELALAEV